MGWHQAMSVVQLIKMPGGSLRAAGESDAELLKRIKSGALVHADIKQPRNPMFHRRFFALLNLSFEYWQPGQVTMPDGSLIEAEKSFERFRKDALILAGFRKLVVNIKNEARYEAQSISFAAMDETEFQQVYRSVFGVCWRLVLIHVPNMTEEAAHNAINSILELD